jgi:hypothetical protein
MTLIDVYVNVNSSLQSADKVLPVSRLPPSTAAQTDPPTDPRNRRFLLRNKY